MAGFKFGCLITLGLVLFAYIPQIHCNEDVQYDQDDDNVQTLLAMKELLRREPMYVLQALSNLRPNLPFGTSKRGIDFGLGRGFSGSQAAKHFMGMAAARYAGGPGKRRKRMAAGN